MDEGGGHPYIPEEEKVTSLSWTSVTVSMKRCMVAFWSLPRDAAGMKSTQRVFHTERLKSWLSVLVSYGLIETPPAVG